MKLLTHPSTNPNTPAACGRSGFTLPEMMVAMTIFGMALMATLGSHLFGLRQDQLVRTKLGASDQARKSLNLLVREIQTAKRVHLGTGSLDTFVPLADGTALQGSVLQIHPTTNLTTFVRYAFDTERGELWRLDSRRPQEPRRVAEHLADATEFRLENHLGTMLTNLTHNPVVACHIEFQQFQYPLTKVGAGHHYDSYQMTFRVTRRAAD